MSDEDHLGLEKLQIATIDAIVGAFECARPFYYSRTARASGDAGGFSYGTHQVSHTSGNLHALLESYCNWTDPKPDPDFAARVRKRLKDVYVKPKPTNKADIAKWEAEVEPKRKALLKDDELKSLVELAAQDPAMRRAQDAFFAARYLKPAIKQARAAGFTKALSVAVAFDSAIHSGPGWWDSHKDDVDKIVGSPASNANEEAWIEAYITYRRNWLVQRAEENPEKYGILKQTLYRPETFANLAKATNWDLALPVKAHTYTITPWDDFPDDYFPDPVERAAGGAFGELGLSAAYDGRAMFVQKSLKTLKYLNPSATADGIYGGQTRTAVEAFQEKNGLPRTGKVDAATYERLCTQVKMALAERPDLSGGTPDGLRKMEDPPKGRTPIASGTAAAGVGAATIGLGMAADGSDGAGTTTTGDAGATTTTVVTTDKTTGATTVTPVQPATPASPTPAQTTETIGAPARTEMTRDPHSWSDPLLALAISVGFVATVVLAAWFFRKTTHT